MLETLECDISLETVLSGSGYTLKIHSEILADGISNR